MGKIERFIVLVLLFAFMIFGIHTREHYAFGGESLLFLTYLGWLVLSFYKHEE